MISVGDVVLSKAGRDANRAFVVTQVLDETYVLLCDGELRKLDKPKKKKLKHIKETKFKPMDEVRANGRVLDADIRKHLNSQKAIDRNSKEVKLV
ncbi:MAG: RNA-binding protein [Eubacteriales bacterium]|nr:RNA-binding protein [Eubacteriales bacterium]